MKNKGGFIVLSLALSFCLLLSFYWVVKVDLDNYMPKVLNVSPASHTPLDIYLDSSVTEANMISSFPFQKYLESGNYYRYDQIKSDLTILNDRFPTNTSSNQEILYTALSDSLYNIKKHLFQTYQPDSLIYLLQWVDKFRYYGEVDSVNQILFDAIYEFWMQKISAKLKVVGEEQRSRTYDFKYRFLVAKCSENRYSIAVRGRSFDKFIYNLTGGHWSHLLNATWNDTSYFVKSLMLFFLTITLASYYLLIKIIYRRWFKKV